MKRMLKLFLYPMLATGITGGSTKEHKVVETTNTKNPRTTKSTRNLSPKDNNDVFILDGFNNKFSKKTDKQQMSLSSRDNDLQSLSVSGDKTLTVTLDEDSWGQIFQIDDTPQIAAFTKNINREQYFRMCIENPNEMELRLTIQLSNGLRKGFLDSNLAVLTYEDGEILMTDTENATGEAGDESAINIPSNFSGEVAWPLSAIALKPWGRNGQLIDLTTVNCIRIDVRPIGFTSGDIYTLDNICITDSPYGSN